MSETIIFKPALQWSGALRRCLTAHPDQEARLAADAAQTVTRRTLADWYAELIGPAPARPTQQADLRRALRRLRARVFATLAVCDVAGLAPLHEVVSTMSHLADLAVGEAYACAMHTLMETHGPPPAIPTPARPGTC